MSSTQPESARIDSLQVLRGVAASLVAAFHLYAAAVAEGEDPGIFALFAHGEIGVDIFFVISGFIIYYTSERKNHLTMREFTAARFWRIVPPYWAILSLYILLALALAILFGDHSRLPDVGQLAVSYLLLPYPDHVIVIAWTLAIEILFYTVFALSYFRFGRVAFFASMLIWVTLTLIYRQMDRLHTDWLAIPLYFGALEFLLGAIVAHLHLRGVRRFQWSCLVAGSAGILAFLLDILGGPREVTAGLSAAMVVYGLLAWQGGLPRSLILWGEASYILYLIHLLLYSVIGRGLSILTGYQVYGSALAMAGMLAVAIAVSCMATLWAERPYQAWYRRRQAAGRQTGRV